MNAALAALTVCAACAVCFLAGLRINLSKTIAMCNRCKHFQAKCAECMAARATYE